MVLSGQVHACWKCTKRLNVDNVMGSLVVICPKCKTPNQLTVAGPMIQREWN